MRETLRQSYLNSLKVQLVVYRIWEGKHSYLDVKTVIEVVMGEHKTVADDGVVRFVRVAPVGSFGRGKVVC